MEKIKPLIIRIEKYIGHVLRSHLPAHSTLGVYDVLEVFVAGPPGFEPGTSGSGDPRHKY